jgi:Type II secretion system protein C
MIWMRWSRVVATCWICSAMVADFIPATPARAEPPAALDNPVAALSLDRLSATRDRPLFSPNRHTRPAVVSILRSSVPPTALPKIELRGTIMDADESLAIVFFAADKQTKRLHVGDEIEGWKITVIEERKLVLALDTRTAEFTIFPDKGDNTAPDRTIPSQPQPGTSLAPARIKQP